MKWEDSEVKKLIKMYEDNISIKNIAIELNRTEASVRNKANRIGCSNPKKYTEEEIKYVKQNYNSYNLTDISKHLGRPKENLCRLAKELGIERTGKKKKNTEGFIDENGLWKKKGWRRKSKEEISNGRSKIMKEWHENNPHPKGMKGKKHSIEYRKQISKRVKEYWDKVTEEELEIRRVRQVKTKIKNGTLNPNKNNKNPYSRTKSGKRKDINNIFFRSSWEANIARYLMKNKIDWEYEPKTFVFEDIKRGCVSYTPDFYLPTLDIWIEVKGWMDDKSRVKLERFGKYFPNESEKLWLLDSNEYKIIEKKYKYIIENWE